LAAEQQETGEIKAADLAKVSGYQLDFQNSNMVHDVMTHENVEIIRSKGVVVFGNPIDDVVVEMSLRN
jgi:site-specific recombinase